MNVTSEQEIFCFSSNLTHYCQCKRRSKRKNGWQATTAEYLYVGNLHFVPYSTATCLFVLKNKPEDGSHSTILYAVVLTKSTEWFPLLMQVCCFLAFALQDQSQLQKQKKRKKKSHIDDNQWRGDYQLIFFSSIHLLHFTVLHWTVFLFPHNTYLDQAYHFQKCYKRISDVFNTTHTANSMFQSTV